jgi:hypothetical protein
MSPFRPRTKVELYFSAIGELLYLIILIAGGIFLVGTSLYQLIIGNFAFFKEHPEIVVISILFIIIGIAIYSSHRKIKNKQKYP